MTQLKDPLAEIASSREAETAAAQTASSISCPVGNCEMEVALSMGHMARLCARHNVVLPLIPE